MPASKQRLALRLEGSQRLFGSMAFFLKECGTVDPSRLSCYELNSINTIETAGFQRAASPLLQCAGTLGIVNPRALIRAFV
jgi:hypothetical protein